MNREDILSMDECEIIKNVSNAYNLKIKTLQDEKDLSKAWNIVKKLFEKGWRIDIRAESKSIEVDGITMKNGSPNTVFARFGRIPDFESLTEGICKLALIIHFEEL